MFSWLQAYSIVFLARGQIFLSHAVSPESFQSR